MLSNEEFMRQRAAKLNSEKIKKEKQEKQEIKQDYTSNKSVFNKRLDKDTKQAYLNTFNNYKPAFYISIPFCIIISLAATTCLLLMGLIRSSFILWSTVLLFFVILYAGVVTYFMKVAVNRHGVTTTNIESLRRQIRQEVEEELRREMRR